MADVTLRFRDRSTIEVRGSRKLARHLRQSGAWNHPGKSDEEILLEFELLAEVCLVLVAKSGLLSSAAHDPCEVLVVHWSRRDMAAAYEEHPDAFDPRRYEEIVRRSECSIMVYLDGPSGQAVRARSIQVSPTIGSYIVAGEPMKKATHKLAAGAIFCPCRGSVWPVLGLGDAHPTGNPTARYRPVEWHRLCEHVEATHVEE